MISWSAPRLPKTVNIVTGVPLTLPKYALEQMGLKPEQNTGGWGDVMSNVAMAADIKKQFPEVQVRLIVTLNDSDTRKFVNRVRDFIPQVLRDESDRPLLDPDAKHPQYYKGIEIYFASVPESLGRTSPNDLEKQDIEKVKESVKHIPYAEMALQYSANNSPFSRLVVKSENIHVYFEEYSEKKESHGYSFFHKNAEAVKIFAGPLAFGVYGFGSKGDAIHTAENKEYVQTWLDKIKSSNPKLAKLNLKLSEIDLAFAYAGDAVMIEDYNKAIDQLAKQKKDKVTVIAFKGKGEVEKVGNRVYIPLNAHPKELAHALVSECTYSPLVTGDGSLSSALETTSKTKSFLYESVEWKAAAMAELFRSVFKNDSELLESANDLMIRQTHELKNAKQSRNGRVDQIISALQNEALHTGIHTYFSRRTLALNIADNTMNLFQFEEIYKNLKASFSRNVFFSEPYLKWLINFAKTFSAREDFPEARLQDQLNDQVYGRSKQLLEKWYSMYTLFELGYSVKSSDVSRIITETKDFFAGKNTITKMKTESELIQMIEQVSGSKKSKQALIDAVNSSTQIREDFLAVRKIFHRNSNKRIALTAKNACAQFYQ